MADFTFNPSDRFDGDFVIFLSDPAAASNGELQLMDAANAGLEKIRNYDNVPDDLKAELAIHQRHCAQDIRRRIEALSLINDNTKKNEAITKLIPSIYRIEGIFSERRLRILSIPFTVTEAKDDNGLIYDIDIFTRDVAIPEDKQKFKAEVDRSIAVMRAVLSERWSLWEAVCEALGLKKSAKADLKAKLNEYLKALNGVAQVGLSNMDKTQTPFAAISLGSLQSEFVAREAGLVKNGYVQRLGWAALAAVLVSTLLYVIAPYFEPTSVIFRFRPFFLLSAGAAIGTWLSFSLRRVQLSFYDLAVLEEDRLNPLLRILFMIGVTTVVGLLFWTKAIVVEVGGLKSDFSHGGAFALLIGLLCGIAERAVTTAVSRKANDFVSNIVGDAGK